MKQVENYSKSKYVPRSFSDTKDSPDSYWKYAQRRSQSFPVGRRNPEAVSYYSSSTTYKPRSHACSSPTYSKCASIHAPEAIHHQGHCKPNRDKHYTTFSPGRKRYDEEVENNEKLKYIHEESENFTDNAEEDADEEAEEEHEEAGEFLDKDYEGQEGDDETEEEFLTSQQLHRGQGVSKKDALKQQRWRTVEQDPRRFRCQQHVDLAFAGHPSSPRYYHNMAEHEVPEPLSDEDFVLTSLKSPTRRSPIDYHRWSKPDRYDDDALPVQSPRRARTKPEIDLIDPESRRSRRCNRCGSVANRKDELPKDGYRFDDRNPTKGPIGKLEGDEAESHEPGCSLRHNPKDFDLSLYSKPRKPRDTKSPMAYEVPEHMDKFCDYSRRYQRKESYPEKMKCMLHGTARVPPRYVEQ
ncbi:uncharacterized protein LOC100881713 isoform X1 [Megachile rotundata]|uniref:uncharacterized protein LOC100881713 isoform X1 n=1 Tax=Megachile rotundata TaxID=143995 RepID=UPI003FD2EBC4